jgi:hypothetical protein
MCVLKFMLCLGHQRDSRYFFTVSLCPLPNLLSTPATQVLAQWPPEQILLLFGSSVGKSNPLVFGINITRMDDGNSLYYYSDLTAYAGAYSQEVI